ncbi:unnamed protein product [Adineta steineri]|uniref:Ig-like domain-containing protein n=1 Tax=Adineta steineri TaxID=433720 RepID=A0A813TKT4_9BILA|nr:unnamed protein product [Adineta steineri]CAF0820479.1 unnamed protein product [Adineta steineri]
MLILLLYIVLHLAGSLVAFDTTTENYTVPVSGKCVLTCYVTEVRSFKVLWQKIDRPIVGGNQTNVQKQEQLTLIAFDGVVYSNKDHYRLESDYVGSYNLIIDRVNEDDQGEYQCQINTEPRKTKRIFLTVQVPPRIVDFRPNPPLHLIRAGSPLTLSCRAEGTPMPYIRWRIRDSDVHRVEPLPPDNSNIWFIPSITHAFPRTVECIADNGVLPASNRIFTINVEYRPIVTVNNDIIPSEQYQNVTLECRVLSRPSARISWEKNSKIIDENKISNTRVNQTMSISQLTIQMNNNDDFGQYNCIAENVHGRMEAIVIVLQELMTTTTKNHRHSKHHSTKTNSNRLFTKIRSALTTAITTTNVNGERDIHISSSSYRLWTSNILIYLLFLFQFRTIYR